MATYPTLPTAYDSEIKPMAKVVIERAEDGTGRGRAFFASEKAQITIKHTFLTATQKATLDGFYIANRLLQVTYTDWFGTTHTAIFTGAPVYKMRVGNYCDAAVTLEDV